MTAWTEEHSDLAAKLWIDGKSASEISTLLKGAHSRNAIIGRIHRLGLAGRSHATRSRSYVRVAPKAPRFTTPKPEPKLRATPATPAGPPLVIIPRAERVETLTATATIMTLGRGVCHWPIGDTHDTDFGFCGRRCHGRYCDAHAAISRSANQGTKHTAAELTRSLRRYI